jgi:hypothetical protein
MEEGAGEDSANIALLPFQPLSKSEARWYRHLSGRHGNYRLACQGLPSQLGCHLSRKEKL